MNEENWWHRTAFGIVALIFGMVFLTCQGMSVTSFLVLFGYVLFLSGMALIGLSLLLAGPPSVDRQVSRIEGLIYIIFSLIAIYPPEATSYLATTLVSIFALDSGVFQIIGGALLPARTSVFGAVNRWLLVVAGICSFIVGIVIIPLADEGISTDQWILGTLLTVVGILNTATCARWRDVARRERVR